MTVTRRLRAEGARAIDEHAIFRSVEERRRVLIEAQAHSKAARRAVARLGAADRQVREPNQAREETGEQDTDARVPMPSEGEVSGVEFW